MANGSPRHRAGRTAGAVRTPLTSPGTRQLDASPLSPFAHVRLGVVMRADLQAPHEVWGVLNPAVARGRDGELYLFPRVVAAGNYSRIGIARVRFDAAGLPMGVEWLGYALEPEQPYEKNPKTGGGVEDPRITFIDPLDCYVMAYTAYGPEGPRVALAVSHDFFDWRRLGLVRFGAQGRVDFDRLSNKDAAFFPQAVNDPDGRSALALFHRPSFRVQTATGRRRPMVPDGLRERRDSMWLAYVPLEAAQADIAALTVPRKPTFFAGPEQPWERLKIGGGPAPVLTPHGWLLVYHGVRGRIVEGVDHQPHVHYSAGVMVLDRWDPRMVRYRSRSPVLQPESDDERYGIVPNVVFPTGLDPRGDGRIDVYYGMADFAIGVAQMAIPEQLPGV